KLGNALANAGRGADATEAYLAAVEGGTAAETLELERRAAEQLLRSGHVERGLSVLNAVLARVGLRMPKTTHGAVALTLWRRLHLRLRGVGFRKRDVSQISAEALTRLDATWSASSLLGLSDIIRGKSFQHLHVRQALDAGEPGRLVRALCAEAITIAS